MKTIQCFAEGNRITTAVLIDKIYQFCIFLHGTPLYKYQEQFARRYIRSVLENDGAEITALFARQTGKCFAKGTKILMGNGSIKNVEDIRVGDYVMSPNSIPVLVTSLGRGSEEMFEVRSREKNHESFVVNKSHILSVVDRKGKVSNISVSEYLKLSNWNKKDNFRGYRVGVEFPEKKLKIDPYFVGLWVGDGVTKDVAVCNVDKEVIDFIYSYAEKLHMDVSEYSYPNRIPNYAIVTKPDKRGKGSLIRQYLKKCVINGEKVIPDEILHNSRRIRLQLLAGLLDTDGWCDTSKGEENTVEISTHLKYLSEQYLYLFRSLGFRASVKEKLAHCNGKKYLNYIVHAYGDFSIVPCKVERRKRKKNILRENPLTFGFDLIPLGVGEYYGFTINSSDHLFLLGDFTVTHNTETVAIVSAGMMIIIPTLANMPMFAGDVRLEQYKNGLNIGIFAPALQQAQIQYGRMRGFMETKRAQAILADDDFQLMFSVSNGQTVSLTNGSRCTAYSASERSNIEGESLQIIVLEECQEISNYVITKSILPMGAAYNASVVCIGTPTIYKSYFYNAIERNKKEAKSKKVHVKNHFEYDYLVGCKYNPKYKKYVDGQIERMGIDSDAFRMSYKLEWITERSLFINWKKFEEKNLDVTQEMRETDLVNTYVAGLDVAGSIGGDSTLLTLTQVDWDTPAIEEVKQDEETGEDIVYKAYNTMWRYAFELKNVPDFEDQVSFLLNVFPAFNIVRMVMDTTREKALYNRINSSVPFEVIPYVFTPKSKSDLYKLADGEIQTGRAKIAANDEAQKTPQFRRFMQQMVDLTKNWRGAYMVVAHPDTKNARDDYPDSYAMSLYGCSFEGESYNVECVDGNKLFQRGRWRGSFGSSGGRMSFGRNIRR